MKKIVLSIITVVVFCIGVTAQNVNIPDVNFKAYLIGSSSINTNMDSEIQVSEANAFTGAINCSNQGINDLTGIEEFTALTILNCYGNNLSTLDVSQNTALTQLNFNHNNVSVIDVNQNIALTFLACSYNNISVLDISQNTALVHLHCGSNNISVLDVSQSSAFIEISCEVNNISTLDLSQKPVLTHLNCSFNNLTNLDVSQNTNLVQLNCDQNNITALDVSQNTAIVYMRCQVNNLSTLNLKNINIASLSYFTALGNPNLTCIEVDDVAVATTALTSIDPASNFSTYCAPLVNIPDANFKAYLVGNSSINTNNDSEIQVSEAEAFSGLINCSSQNISDLTGIEAFTTLTELICQDNNLSNLDVSQNTALSKLACGNNPLGTLDVSQITALEILQANNNNLSTLDVSQNTTLYRLICLDNNLTSLDVSQNTNIYWLLCGDNNLNSLDLSQNTNLEILTCGNNNLTTLDVSQNLGLYNFSCNGNNLNTLNMKNINTSTMASFSAISNPNLTCIQVDDVAAATAAWTDIDPQTSYSENCNPIAVTSITVQGEAGANTISTLAGTLQMEASVLPMNADDNTYTWSVIDGTGSATIDQSGLLTAMTDGTVSITATANDGSGVFGTVEIIISNQSSNTIEQSIIYNLSIYPNPTTAQIVVSANSTIEAITIMDIMGRRVKTIISPNNAINVSDLSKGIYFLQIQIDENLLSKKMIKE